jgi:hypothetical protein
MAVSSVAYEYVVENVGWTGGTTSRNASSYAYVVLNTGADLVRRGMAYEYFLEGDVNTATPTPHIWYLKPTEGRAGDGFDIVGMGFGALAATYSGVARMDFGSPTGQVTLSVSSWTQVAANAAAYGADRLISEDPVVSRSGLNLSTNFDGTGALGSPWVTTQTWTLSGGQVATSNATATALATFSVPGTVLCTWAGAGVGVGYALFHYVDTLNYCYFDPATNTMYQVLAGVTTSLGDAAGATNGNNPVTFVCNGTSIVVSNSGGTLFTATPNAALVSTYRHGLGYQAAGSAFTTWEHDSGIAETTQIDTEHQVVSVVVPSNAVPPGYPVTIQTNGA